MLNGKVGLGLFISGVLMLLCLRILNDRDDWILASAQLPPTPPVLQILEFSAARDGFAEIEVEVDASVPQPVLERYIYPRTSPSALDLGWEVSRDGVVIAAGDARDYLYLEEMPSLLGRLRRIVMQVPFGRNEAHWNSFGFAGSRTVARGIGRFPTKAGERYSVEVAANGDSRDLEQMSPKVLLRAERRAWQIHYERVRTLGYLGLALIVTGLTIIAAARLRELLLSRRL